MVIAEYIKISDQFLSGLVPVFNIMEQVNSANTTEEIMIDFTHASFVTPIFVLPLMIFLKDEKHKVTTSNTTEYLSVIRWEKGLIADEMRLSTFKALIEGFSSKTYIPIINFPATNDSEDIKNHILTAVENLLIRQAKIETNVATGIKYMIEECVDNITQHSKSERGYIFAQAYPHKQYLDICVADNGITLLGSYHENNDFDIETDLEAIQAANRGISTKNLPNAENRGYGIITSKRMLVNGLNGSFVMISGKSMFLYNKDINKFIDLPNGLKCPGTIVSMRIPYQNENFNYINYVE